MQETNLLFTVRDRLSNIYEPREAQAIARLLLTKQFSLSTTALYTDSVDTLTAEQQEDLERTMARLENNEPVQYVLGEADFYDLLFYVNESVLIPRPETEELVSWVINDFKETPHPIHLLDVGTGSGCIAVTLARELPHAKLTGWDISGAALSVARENARRNRIEATFAQVDVLKQVLEAEQLPLWEAIVSNPPYICRSERASLAANVLDFEPHKALFVVDDDALIFYRALARLAMRQLKPGGSLYVEINEHFGPETEELFQQTGLKHIEMRKDAFGRNRMIKAER